MKILCWNADDAVWKHWNQVIDSNASLERVDRFDDLNESLQKQSFNYCFIYLSDDSFSKQVENVVTLCLNFPNKKIIVFPNQSSQQAALRLFSVGVSGQCAPYIGREQLSLVLSVVESGEIWGGKAFIQQLITQSAATVINVQHNDLEDLSERELSVAQYIAKGLSNRQIALEMSITERTVKAHLTSIFKKTNTKDRLALGLLAQSNDQTL
ncbi:LuxR family transcriptional regulator [Marinomonas ushuaiensis DSM 15871]|uniref:LuxR family transcriptional regulator n=1 Tax=Marinomonas ushuaiensis DSM 15871 TaxID=1122207 RepID=X7E1X7_9GAMM|nr:response regulator transcription factor [Marinomonas ushuaiensis]ETX09860.1 LuxR family transcriptional regulator [Marinomonas ushuaiensis DSM 15871]